MRLLYSLLLIVFLIAIPTYSQNIMGKIVNENNQSVPYVNIVLLSLPDSTFISGTISNEKGYFTLPNNEKGALIRFSAIGFKNIYKSKADNDFNLIVMTSDSKILNEITITADMPQVRNYGSKSIIRIKNTILSKMGDASTMFSNTPGLHQGANGIEVNGLGKPIFILDGREINSTEILDLLQANNIKEIEIDRVPSIEYSADGRPLVKITTIKSANDLLFLAVGNRMGIKRKFSDAFDLNMKYKSNKLSSNIEYLGGKTATMNKENYFRNIFHETYTFSSIQNRESPKNTKAHQVRWSTDFDINKYQQLGFEYYFQSMNKSTKDIGNDLLTYGNSSKSKDIYRENKALTGLHNLTFMYKYQKGKHNFQAVQDLAFNKAKSNYIIKEKQDYNNKEIFTETNNKYNLYTSNIRYSTTLPWEIGLTTGIKYDIINSHSTTESDNPDMMNGNYFVKNKVAEHNPQTYVSFSRKFGGIIIKPAIRYQYMYRKIESLNKGEGSNKVKQEYSSLFPSISVTYEINPKISFYMRYNRNIIHPKFSELNPGNVYLDSLSYQEGNPNLYATLINRILLGISWKDFSFDVKYTYEKNPIITIENPIMSGSNIVKTSSINLESQQDLSFNISYNKTFSHLNLYAEGEIVFPYGNFYYLNNFHKANKISFNGNLNLNYKVKPNIGLFTSLNYQGYRTVLSMSQKPVNNWSIGLAGSFLDNRLSLNVMVSDILKGANYNNLTYRYGWVESGTCGTNDMRGIMFKVSYTIFTKKIKIRSKQGNSDIIQRI